MEKSGEKMTMMKKKEKDTEVGESSTSCSSNIWGSSWEFVEQGVTTPLLNLFSYFFTSKTTQPTTSKLSPPPTKSTEDQLLSSTRSIAPQTLRHGRPPRPPVNSGRGGQTN